MKPEFCRSNLPKVAILGALCLLFWAAPAVAQLAPWQQPPDAGPHPSSLPGGEGTMNSPLPAGEGILRDGSPTPATSEDYEQDGSPLGIRGGPLPELAYNFAHDRFWSRVEFLAGGPRALRLLPCSQRARPGLTLRKRAFWAAGTSVLLGGEGSQRRLSAR